MAAWIADGATRAAADFSGKEDEGIDGFSHEVLRCPTHFLEPFDLQFTASTWTQWDGTAQNNMFKGSRCKIPLVSDDLEKIGDIKSS